LLPSFVAASPSPAFDSFDSTPPDFSFTRGSSEQMNGFLDAHNIVRAAHGAVPLSWSETLADLAAIWADNCEFRATEGILLQVPYGENIVAATGFFPITSAVGMFTQDAASYDPASPTYSHFTQVIWQSTTQLGCAISSCSGLFDPESGTASFYVCLYDPPGNVMGEASENVQV